MKLFNRSALALTLLSSIASTKPMEKGPKDEIIATLDYADIQIEVKQHTIATMQLALGFLSNVTGQTTSELIRQNAYALALLIPTTIITQKILSSKLPDSDSSKTFQSICPYITAACYAGGAILGRTLNYVNCARKHIR